MTDPVTAAILASGLAGAAAVLALAVGAVAWVIWDLKRGMRE